MLDELTIHNLAIKYPNTVDLVREVERMKIEELIKLEPYLSCYEEGYEQGKRDAEISYQRGKTYALDKLMKYAFDLMCGYDENGMIGKYCKGIGCSATCCEYKYLENYAEDIKKEQMKGEHND